MTEPRLRHERLDKAAAALREAKVDVLLLTPGADLEYLTGFRHTHAGERLLAMALQSDGSSRWMAPRMNSRQVAEAGIDPELLRCWDDSGGYLDCLEWLLLGAHRVAWDDEARSGFLMELLQRFPVQISPASALMRRLRLCKDESELQLLRQAGAAVDAVREKAIELCRPGRTELQVDAGLRRLLGEQSPGGEVAFTIVASGPNSALPHHDTGDRKLCAGDVVILDFGTREQGYHSDITITCSVGEPADGRVHEIYALVLEAQQRALEAVRPGAPCAEIDRAARGVIEAAGYGDYFIHRTGHGLGLQVHEPPYLTGENSEPVQEGMVFSIEPGIYLPGAFGVRLEVIAAAGRRGAELINAPSLKKLAQAPA